MNLLRKLGFNAQNIKTSTARAIIIIKFCFPLVVKKSAVFLENLLKLLPGAKKMGLNNVNIDPKIMKRTEAIILSMTMEERKNPSILKASRKKRIADGSGTTVTDVNKLLIQFEEMKKMMKMMGNGNFKMPF